MKFSPLLSGIAVIAAFPLLVIASLVEVMAEDAGLS